VGEKFGSVKASENFFRVAKRATKIFARRPRSENFVTHVLKIAAGAQASACFNARVQESGNYFQNFHQGDFFGMEVAGAGFAGGSVGSLIITGAEGIGGRLIRTSRFGSRSGSSSPKPVATFGPRGGRGGGELACGFGSGCGSLM
jgi:hypothetical protein